MGISGLIDYWTAALFSPQGFPSGQIVYDLTTSFDREHEYIENFELYRRTFLVIAIADHAEGNDSETLSSQLEELKFLVCSHHAPSNALERLILL